MTSRTPVVLVGLGLALAALALGCGSKVTLENYDLIKDGMTLAQVQSILGPGEVQASAGLTIGKFGGSAQVYVWNDKEAKKQIMVTFVDGKVTLKTQSGL